MKCDGFKHSETLAHHTSITFLIFCISKSKVSDDLDDNKPVNARRGNIPCRKMIDVDRPGTGGFVLD